MTEAKAQKQDAFGTQMHARFARIFHFSYLFWGKIV